MWGRVALAGFLGQPCEISRWIRAIPVGSPNQAAHLGPVTTASLDRELGLALDLARTCGALALSYQTGGLLATREKANDEGPVTRADLECNAQIVRALRDAFPGDDIIAEESDPVVDGRARCWYIDPIDGTSEFARGEAEWAVQIGLCIDGQPVLGVVHEAGAGRLLWGLCWRDQTIAQLEVEGRRTPLRTGSSDMTGLRLASSKSHASPKIRDAMRALEIPDARNFRMGSVGVKMSTVARGVADLYVHPSRGTKLWDSCGPHAVLAAAGGQLTDVRGEALVYDPRRLGNDHGLLASHGPHHAEIVAALAPVIGDWFA